MLNKVLSLVNDAERDIIKIAGSAMTLEVFDLVKDRFTNELDRVVYYAPGLAFVVNELDPDQEDIIPIAIRWYLVMILNLTGEMPISSERPDLPAKLHIVR